MRLKVTFEVVIDALQELPQEAVEEIAGDLASRVLDAKGWSRDGATVLFKQEVFGDTWRGI